MGNSDQPEGTMRVVNSTSRSSCAYACGLDQQNVYMRTAMTATETMKGIIELEELKKDTAMTRSILSSAQKVLVADELEGNEHIAQLVTAVRVKYSSMLQAVQHYRALATRREKLWMIFHRFSTEEGRQLCDTCDKAMGLSAPDMFWQLLLERKFLAKISQQ